MISATPSLPPPAIEQPAPHQVSYGLVTGRAARGTHMVIVSANGRRLASEPLRGRRFSLRVSLPTGDVTNQHIDELAGLLSKGDLLVDGGNTYYKDDLLHAAQLKEKGIAFVDAGVSGGICIG